LQDFGDCSQSSQIGPHLVQPLSVTLSATTPKINADSLNMLTHSPRGYIRPQVWHFQAAPGADRFPPAARLA
jgi:hypothetical protein